MIETLECVNGHGNVSFFVIFLNREDR